VYPIRTVHALITEVCSGIKGTCLSADGILTIGRYHAPHFFPHLLELTFTQCYMFQHCLFILRQPVINTLPSYTGISDAAVGSTIYN
jgi:hypothetical protein